MPNHTELRGILAAVTTPFSANGEAVDEQRLRGQVERLIAAGIHGLVPTGTTGEFTSLDPDEYRRVIELYVQAANGRGPGHRRHWRLVDQRRDRLGAACRKGRGRCHHDRPALL